MHLKTRKLGDLKKINFLFDNTEKYIIVFGIKCLYLNLQCFKMLKQKEKCELSSINGMVVTLGKELNVKTPYNSVVSNIISAREKNIYTKNTMDKIELIGKPNYKS